MEVDGVDQPLQIFAGNRIQCLGGRGLAASGNYGRPHASYAALAWAARIHQELGNTLSKRIYEAATTANDWRGACARGCDGCCLVPSEARGTDSGNFSMTVLDAITLVEHHGEILASAPDIDDKATRAVAEAKRTGDAVRCPHLTDDGKCAIYEHRPVACKIWFSADLALCAKNRNGGYQVGVNMWTDASNQLRIAFEKPFEDFVAAIAPDMEFRGYDLLLNFEVIAKLGRVNLLETLKVKIDAGEQSDWNPFD